MFIRQILEFNKKYQHYKFGIETNLYRDLLVDNIRDEKVRYEKEIGQAAEPVTDFLNTGDFLHRRSFVFMLPMGMLCFSHNYLTPSIERIRLIERRAPQTTRSEAP